MFKCAIGTVGIYDLPLMFEEGDISGRSTGQNYLENVLGTDETLLKAFSPSYNIDKLKAAVFIVHAGEDARAPIELTILISTCYWRMRAMVFTKKNTELLTTNK